MTGCKIHPVPSMERMVVVVAVGEMLEEMMAEVEEMLEMEETLVKKRRHSKTSSAYE